MARKDVNIGLTGNDGTGDSIRDAFAKVNSNFQELYASQGLEAGLTFDNLVDVQKPLKPSTVLGLDNLGKTIVSRNLISNPGISIDATSDPENIIFSISGLQIKDDQNPELSNDLKAGGFRLTLLGAPTADQDAVTRRWVYQNFLNRDSIDLSGTVNLPEGSSLRKNIKLTPFPNNGNVNNGEKFFTLKAADGVAAKTDVLLKYQATDPANLTRKDYVDTKLSLEGTNALDPTTGQVNRGMGVMTGPLILNDHPSPYVGITRKTDPTGSLFVEADYRAATKGYVDSNVHNSPSNIYVSTIGNDDMWDFVNDRPNPVYGYPEEEVGRSWAKAFKSVRQAARFAKKYIDRVNLQNTPYQVERTAIYRHEPAGTDSISSPRTRVRVSLQNHGFVDGDYVVVSGAILGSLDTRALNGIHRVNKVDDFLFELDLKQLVTFTNPETLNNGKITIALANKKDGPYSLSTRVDYGYRGFFIPKPEITIMIESGVYYEDLPIIIPANVAVKGDEFRRTLIKPKQGPANHALNTSLKFVRGDRSQNSDYWYTTHYYHMFGDSVGDVNVQNSTVMQIRRAAYRPKSGMRFILGTTGGLPNVFRVGPERTITYIEPDIANGISTGTYQFSIVDDNGDPKPLTADIGNNDRIEFLLDNEHCDMFLIGDAFQARNISFVGSKGFVMAFDPNGQILTRSPYAQVCSTFAGEGGGGQLVDGMAGNQVCYVQDYSYTNPKTGFQGATGTKMTVSGLVRKPEVPNTFYHNKKRYVIIETTDPDINGTATLTLSSATPIELDYTYLEDGYLENGTQILIQTAGNRSMLSNDFTMINDLGYGIVVENNGVCEAVSQFTYYCRIGYVARSGGQIRSVTGSSCYGLIGLQSEGSDANEAIQIGRLRTNPGNIMTPYIDDPLSEGNLGAVGFEVGGLESKPLRNATFKLNKHEVIINTIQRARLPGGTLTDGPLKVTTEYIHPFTTGDSVQIVSVRGLELKPLIPGGPNRLTDLDGATFDITVVDDFTFTLDGTDSTDYASDLGSYAFADLTCRAISNLVVGAQDVIFTIKGDPSPANINGLVRFDSLADNTTGDTVLKVRSLSRPAVKGMKFFVPNGTVQHTVTDVSQVLVTFKVYPRPTPTGDNDNKIGDRNLWIITDIITNTASISGTTLTSVGLTTEYIGRLVVGAGVEPETYITDVINGTTATVSYAQAVSSMNMDFVQVPVVGWSFQLLDTNLGVDLDYTRYKVDTTIDDIVYDYTYNRWNIPLDKELTVNMVDQVASAQDTRVDGIWDLTLDYPLELDIPNTNPATQFIFTNSYWNINVDPSLTNPLPTYLDNFNKPQAKKINLYQQKTVSASQITNKPAIINSSALRFASSFDPSIYRILGKTIDDGITIDTYSITAASDPLIGFNTFAIAKLDDNIEWIKKEVLGYLNTIYPNLEYNTAICARDVGYIIQNIQFDLAYGGNTRARAAGKAYYQQGNPSANKVLADQKPETIDAIAFATSAALTALNLYDGASPTQTALPYRGSNLNGVAQINANKTFIEEEVIAYLNVAYPGFNYDEEKCARDVGLILDAVLGDVILGTNYLSRHAGLAYIRSYSSNVTDNQKLQTIDGINKSKELAISLISDPDVISLIDQNYGIVTDIITAVSESAAGTLTFTQPLNPDDGYMNAVNQLQTNREFIQNEVVAYVSDNFTGYTYTPAIQAKCERDIGNVIDAVVYDTTLNTNYNAVVTGLAYQRANSAYLGAQQKVQTTEGILFAKRAALDIGAVAVDPSATTRISGAFDQVIDLLNGGSTPILTFPTPVGASQNVVNAKDQLVQNREFIRQEIVAYVNFNNPPAGYDQAKCSRDIGYMVDALCYDIMYGGNSASYRAAEAYFVGAVSQLGAGQSTATYNAFGRLQEVVKDVIEGTLITRTFGNTSTQNVDGGVATSTESTVLFNRIKIIRDAINVGNLNSLPALVYPDYQWADIGLVNAADDLSSEKATIQTNVSTYILNSFSGFTYDVQACIRDTGYIVDALSFDLMYGGNSQTTDAGNAYYYGATLYIAEQVEVTRIVYEYLSSVVDKVIKAEPVTVTTGNTFTQDLSNPIGSDNAVNTSNGLIQNIINIIAQGLNAAPVVINPSYTAGVNYNDMNDEKITILNNIELIKSTTITYLNGKYNSGFKYNQTTCRRDVNYMLDAIAYDLEYGGNVKSRAAALAYYDGTAAYVLSNQRTQTLTAIERLRDVTKVVVVEGDVTRSTGNILSQNKGGTPGVVGVDDTRVNALANIIYNIVRYGLTDPAHPVPARDLGIRRSYQDPAAPDYQAQSINNSIVAEVDSDVKLIALMNQVAAIIEKGPVNPTGLGAVPHIIEYTQILDTLQTLDFPATATSLQYNGKLTGLGIPNIGDIDPADPTNVLTDSTRIRVVEQLFDPSNENITIGYRVKISNRLTQSIPAGTEITIEGPGSNYLFDLNSNLDKRHHAGDKLGITTTFSTVRATGHDFLEVGTGGFDDSNYPHNVYGQPVNPATAGSIVKEVGTGRVFHVSTDQDGVFRVGSLFNVNQGDGSVSIAAKIGFSGVTSLSFLTGATVTQFSYDSKLEDNKDSNVPTEKAIKTYINNLISGRFSLDNSQTPQKGLLTLDGNSIMVGGLNMGFNAIQNIVNSTETNGYGGVNRKYVDSVFAGGTIDYSGSNAITTTGKRNEVLAFEMITDNTTVGGAFTNRGGIDLNNNKLLRVKTPAISTDGANKGYVDQAIATGGVRTGWQGFTLSNTTTRNTVTRISILNNGAGYTTPPGVVVFSPLGTGAQARAVLTAGSGPRSISEIVVDSGGYGYIDQPTIIIGGSIASVDINNSGQGFSGTPTITFSNPQVVGGTPATGYVKMAGAGNSQIIDSVVITNAGIGYTAVPTITVTGGGTPTVAASLVANLQPGSGATAFAVISPTPKNIDLNGNKVTGSADPTLTTDLVNLNYFNNQNFIGKIRDVAITGVPASGDFLVFTGLTPDGSTGSMVNVGITAGSDIEVSRSNNSLTMSIKAGVITDADVSPSAGILQTKLALNKSKTVVSTSAPGPSDFGVAAFTDNEFTIDSGLVRIRQSNNRTTGVGLDKIQQISNFTVLGRYAAADAADSNGTVTELPPANLKAMLGLTTTTVGALINDDTLGGLNPDGTDVGLALRSNGTNSYGALLKRGGTMRGPITFNDLGLEAGNVEITPIIRVLTTNKLDIGKSDFRFRDIYSQGFKGDTFTGKTFGAVDAPTTYTSGTTPDFFGKSTFAGTADRVKNVLKGTAIGSGDIMIKAGLTEGDFSGIAECTISVLADEAANNKTIVRRSDTGQITATQFNGPVSGNATSASNLRSGSTDYAPTSSNTGSGAVLMINGNINATTFTGTALTAKYADLAENYIADKQYEPGTVVEFGGEFEVTEAEDETRRVAGVVSTNPAYLMNSEAEGQNVVAVALQGRVPVKVRGKIRKGDMLVSGGSGYARPCQDPKLGTVIGKALENFDGVEGVIEVVVGRL